MYFYNLFIDKCYLLLNYIILKINYYSFIYFISFWIVICVKYYLLWNVYLLKIILYLLIYFYSIFIIYLTIIFILIKYKKSKIERDHIY